MDGISESATEEKRAQVMSKSSIVPTLSSQIWFIMRCDGCIFEDYRMVCEWLMRALGLAAQGVDIKSFKQ